MEVVLSQQVSNHSIRDSASSFECDALTMDALLEWNSVGPTKLRLDQPQLLTGPNSEAWLHKGKSRDSADESEIESTPAVSMHAASTDATRRSPEVYAPVEVVLAASLRFDSASNAIGLHCDAELKRERLLRLLDQQQSWYDAQQQAALAAEQFLSLCEHHQQQWLQPNQQT